MVTEKKFYLTKEGLAKIKKEYNSLKSLKFAKVTGETPKVLHSEDLSQEYLSFQEDLSFMETRLTELEYILKNTELIKSPVKSQQKAIGLGATILVDAAGKKNEFTLVGSLEANPDNGLISDESPVGKALLGHKIGDLVAIPLPAKPVYKIKKIEYKIV
jgi:transcription elongation factor GreA